MGRGSSEKTYVVANQINEGWAKFVGLPILPRPVSSSRDVRCVNWPLRETFEEGHVKCRGPIIDTWPELVLITSHNKDGLDIASRISLRSDDRERYEYFRLSSLSGFVNEKRRPVERSSLRCLHCWMDGFEGVLDKRRLGTVNFGFL